MMEKVIAIAFGIHKDNTQRQAEETSHQGQEKKAT